MFKIISSGWNCKDWIPQTLYSVNIQTAKDWEICIGYDGGDGGEEFIKEWCELDPEHRKYFINDRQMYAPHNQFKALEILSPADDDIVIFLDLDGDMLAHQGVLEKVRENYADGVTLLTYGNYRPVPAAEESPRVQPFPDDVVANNSFRNYVLYGGQCSFNHLRTLKGIVAKNIPPSSARWPDGRWHVSGIDYLVMLSGMELVGSRYKVCQEILLIYNNANPFADNLTHPQETSECNVKFLKDTPLQRLP